MSQLDLFDYKPVLEKYDGKPIPADVVKDQRYAFIQPDAALMSLPLRSKHGESGAELSELLPHLASVADDLAIVKSVHTDQFNHAPAQLFMNTGSPLQGRPCLAPGKLRPRQPGRRLPASWSCNRARARAPARTTGAAVSSPRNTRASPSAARAAPS